MWFLGLPERLAVRKEAEDSELTKDLIPTLTAVTEDNH
jgi:hypothetical protein